MADVCIILCGRCVTFARVVIRFVQAERVIIGTETLCKVIPPVQVIRTYRKLINKLAQLSMKICLIPMRQEPYYYHPPAIVYVCWVQVSGNQESVYFSEGI